MHVEAESDDEFWGRFSRECLEAVVVGLERQAAGGFNRFSAEHAAATAVLCAQPDLAGRMQALLNTLSDDAYWAGAIANFELPSGQTPQSRPIVTFEEADQRYPLFSLSEFRGKLASGSWGSAHLELCEAGRFDEAWNVAESDLDKEEVASAAAVLGNVDFALGIADSIELPEFRRSNVRMVVGIEYARRRLRERFIAHLGDPTGRAMSGEVGLYYVLALAGREPWQPYPFPDW